MKLEQSKMNIHSYFKQLEKNLHYNSNSNYVLIGNTIYLNTTLAFTTDSYALDGLPYFNPIRGTDEIFNQIIKFKKQVNKNENQ